MTPLAYALAAALLIAVAYMLGAPLFPENAGTILVATPGEFV